MPLSSEKKSELFSRFFHELSKDNYDELPLILSEFESVSFDDKQTYYNFLINIGEGLINLIRDKYDNSGENGPKYAIDVINKLEQCGINNQVLLPNYTQHGLIQELRELRNLLQLEEAQFSAPEIIYSENSSNYHPNLSSSSVPVFAPEVSDRRERPLTFSNTTIQDLANQSVEQICQEIDKLLGANWEMDLYPKKVIQLLEIIKRDNPSKFQDLINFDKGGQENNTLLLTALSLEHLGVAEYLLDNQARINVSNMFGLDPIHMLAMVHINKNKHVRDSQATIESTIISIDNIPQTTAFTDQQILERLEQVKKILKLMQQNNPKYFNDNINQPKTLNSTANSSTPLAKVIAYNKKVSHLEEIVDLWRQFGANIPASVPIARFVLDSYDVNFILEVNKLFPNAFTPDALNQKRSNQTITIIREFMLGLYGETAKQVFPAIIAIKKINNNSNAIMDCIKNACNGILLTVARNEILAIMSGGHMEHILNASPQELLSQLDALKDRLRLIGIYDENIKSKSEVEKFLVDRIKSIENFNPQQSSLESNKLLIIKWLNALKDDLICAPRINEDEEILQKYSSNSNYWKLT